MTQISRINDKKIPSAKSWLMIVKLFLKQEFFQNWLIVRLMIASFLANLADWIILALFIQPTESHIILHYNVYFGVDATGNWKRVFTLPLVGVVLMLINWLLAFYFFRNKERIASHILMMASLMLQLSLLIASVSVILINY